MSPVQNKYQSELKILVSCRLQIFKDERFQSLKLFTNKSVNLHSDEYCLLPDEKRKMIEKHLSREILETDW